jgi:hypothetical protein
MRLCVVSLCITGWHVAQVSEAKLARGGGFAAELHGRG